MSLFNAKHNLLALFLCTLLIVQPIVTVPPQELCAEPCQTYAIVCFISFCLGVALCALIHKYCVHQPVIPPLEKTDQKSSVAEAMADRKQLLEDLQANIPLIKEQQEKILHSVNKQKKRIEKLASSNKMINLSLLLFMSQTSFTIGKDNQSLTKTVQFKQEMCGSILVPVAWYWMREAKKQKKLFEQYQQKLSMPENQLLLQENII